VGTHEGGGAREMGIRGAVPRMARYGMEQCWCVGIRGAWCPRWDDARVLSNLMVDGVKKDGWRGV
jgi:hypothetical protein